MSGNSISRKRVSKAIYLLTGSVVLIVAAFLVLALTNTALTQSMMGDKDSLTGQIVAVDDSHNLKTLTIISDELGKYPTDTITIFLSKGTDVKLCTMNDPAEESMVTRDVTIEYHEVSGLAVADSVSEQC